MTLHSHHHGHISEELTCKEEKLRSTQCNLKTRVKGGVKNYLLIEINCAKALEMAYISPEACRKYLHIHKISKYTDFGYQGELEKKLQKHQNT